MKLFGGNKGKAGFLAPSALVGAAVAAGLVLRPEGRRAEAVIGGIGNVTMSTNPHNFSASSSGIHATSETQVCIFCHTPHHAMTGDASLLNAPLWNHKLSTALYKVSNAPGSTGTQLSEPRKSPDGSSKLCLSCHDGTIGIGELGTKTVLMAPDACLDSGGRLISAGGSCGAYIGNDLTSHHLVSLPVNDALIANKAEQCRNLEISQIVKYPWNDPNPQADKVLLRPTAQDFRGTTGIAGDAFGVPSNNRYKGGYNYGVQCSSCHDPHLWTAAASNAIAGYKFIVAPANDMCNACHCTCNQDDQSPTFGQCL